MPTVTEFQRKQVEEAARAVRRRKLLNPLPPLTTVPPPEAPRRVTLPRPIPPADETFLPAPLLAPLPLPTSAEPYAVAASSAAAVTPASDIAKLFGSRDDLRRAIILREVLGPPRSLQPLDVIGNG